MSIIIEDKSDIELLSYFFEQFYLSNQMKECVAESEDDTDLQNRINNIEKWCREQADAKKNFAKKMLEISRKVEKISNLVSEIEMENITPKDDATAKPTTYRHYGDSYVNRIPHIKSMNGDGSFVLKSGVVAKWTIKDILFLKKEIPNVEKNFKELSYKTKFSEHTVGGLCCAIEYGYFDEYLNEWEQIDADNTYGNWKPEIENNPQKRIEKGMI